MDYDTGKTLENILRNQEQIIQMLRVIGDMTYQGNKKKRKKTNKTEENEEETEDEEEDITNIGAE